MDKNIKRLKTLMNSSNIHASDSIKLSSYMKDTHSYAVRAREVGKTPAYNGIYERYKKVMDDHKNSK